MRFAALFWCQAFAAFNDNFLKSALTVLILYRARDQSSLVALAGAVFIGPFLICSGLAGEMADRFDKAVLATRIKAVEVGAAAIAVLGFFLQSVPILFAALAAFGVLASLFGPVKYGLLPDLLTTERLPFANALIDFATFLAILLGTAIGTALGTREAAPLAILVMSCAIAALATAILIPRPGAARPNLALRFNPLASSRDLLEVLRQSRGVWHAALVNAWFWLCGISCLTLLPVLTKVAFLRGPDAVMLGLTIFSLGIGVGSFLAALMLKGTISLRPARLGSALLGAGALGVAVSNGLLLTYGLLFFVSVSGGLIAVPSFAAIQAWADPGSRARAVAGTNILSAAFMVAATLMISLLLHFDTSPRTIFGGLGVTAIVVTSLMRIDGAYHTPPRTPPA